MVTVTLTIDSRPVTVPAGITVWEAAKATGIDIPILCHHEKLRPVGICRMCVVDIGGRVLAASCVRPCEDGMKIETASSKVEKHRRMLTALLLADHPTPCAKEKTTGDDLLDELARRYSMTKAEYAVFGTRSHPRGSDRSIRARRPACAATRPKRRLQPGDPETRRRAKARRERIGRPRR